MAKNITRWKPDTCDCVLEYEWDSETSEDDRVHIFKNLINRCDSHNGITDIKALYGHVLGENQTKNATLKKIMDNIPRLKVKKIQEDDTKVEILDPKVKYNWSFTGRDHQRQLVVELQGANLTALEKTTLATTVDSLNKSVSIT